MARKKIKRYDGEEGSYVSDDDLDQRVYSSRGTGAGLSDDDEEGGGLHEVEYKPEPKTVNTFKQKVIPSNLFRGNEDIDEEDTSAYHGLPSRKYLKNKPSPKKKQENADKVKNNRPPEKVEEKKEESKSSKVKTKSSVNNFFKNPFGFKSGGSVRGHGIESRGKTKGRFV